MVNSASLSSLSNIDLIINRTNILGSQSDKVSTTDGSASALAFANAINALQSEHKISASALQNQVNLGIFTSGVISAGQLSINQVPMIDPVGTDISLINTINLQSGVTGVIATQPGGVGTAILLNAEDGRNIQIKTNGSSTASFANFDMSSGLSLDKVQRAGIMLRSSSDIEISGAHPEKTGVSAGDFSVLSNTGTGKLQASVVAPITDLNTTYSIVFNNSGQSFSIYDDKMPSKPVEGFENLDYIPGQKISFQSFSLSLSGAPQPGDVFNLAVEKPAFQDVFKTIDTLTKAIKNNQNDASCLIYEVGLGLSNLNNVLVNFSKVQSIVGANLNVADSQVDIHAQSELITREFLSQIEDLDYAKALSDLTQASFVLEAAQKSFVHIQSLSIFNYLRS